MFGNLSGDWRRNKVLNPGGMFGKGHRRRGGGGGSSSVHPAPSAPAGSWQHEKQMMEMKHKHEMEMMKMKLEMAKLQRAGVPWFCFGSCICHYPMCSRGIRSAIDP